MQFTDFVQIGFYLVLLVALAPAIGRFMHAGIEGNPGRWAAPFGLLERGIYRVCGIDPTREQTWRQYALAFLWLNLGGFLLLYGMQRLQAWLPLNPAGLPAVPPHLAFNTAVSFVTNTNWQSYGGESTLSYLVQMAGLTMQNFVSPAVGLAVLVALVRGFARKEATTIGNFWVDTTRSVLYVFLPLAIVFAVILVWQGVPQNFHSYVDATGLEGAKQTIAQGPVASQIAIKQLGTNGGGYFNANSAHPYENPTPLTNFLEMFAILALAAGQVFMLGRMVGDKRQAWALTWTMFILLVAVLGWCYVAELHGNPFLRAAGVDPAAYNMEGKEVRFGLPTSVLWATATSAASNGSVNAMHDSFTPLGGMAPMFNLMMAEVVYGGVGSGLYGMLLNAIIAVFVAGLMVGRTPEYLGKKIEAPEMKLTVIAILTTPVGVLLIGAFAAALPIGQVGLANPGPHGLSEILYAFASGTGNNGSAFAGLTAATDFYDTLLGLAMLLGRYGVIVPVLAIAGSLAAKKKIPESAGTFPTHGLQFITLLIGVIVIVGALNFVPVLALGPLAEHFAMLSGTQF